MRHTRRTIRNAFLELLEAAGYSPNDYENDPIEDLIALASRAVLAYKLYQDPRYSKQIEILSAACLEIAQTGGLKLNA